MASMVLFLVAFYILIMFIVGVATSIATAVITKTSKDYPYSFFVLSFALALAGILFL